MKKLLLFLYPILLFTACTFNDQKSNQKTSEITGEKISQTDMAPKPATESQYFEINGKAGGVIESKSGMILTVPEKGFVYENGKPVEGLVKIEVAEVDGIGEIILNGLETVSDKGKPLETGGMFYFDATSDGKRVFINPENPAYVQVPASGSTQDFMLWKGKKDKNGKLSWTDPKPMENWLVPVDLDLLDFYPENFENEVRKGMPFRNYVTPTESLTDSLFYSLAATHFTGSDNLSGVGCTDCGVSPASIKVLKEKRFNNTLISTNEFALRVKEIFKSCNTEVLNVYINNLDKNLWECDNLAADLLKGEPELQKKFRAFAGEKLGKVKPDKNLQRLAGYYKKRFLAV
jgi:hypothetical protein